MTNEHDPRLAHFEDEPPPGEDLRLWRALSSKLEPPPPSVPSLALLKVAAVVVGVVGAIAVLRPVPQPVAKPTPAPEFVTAPAPTVPTPARAPSSLEAETALIREAQTALRQRDPRRALAATDRHRASFSAGLLAQERDALHAIALCKLHDARAILAQRSFAHDWPASPLSARVRQACE